MTRRIYKNDPIHEAICEFRFACDAPWDDDARARIAQEFQPFSPEPPKPLNRHTALLSTDPQGRPSITPEQVETHEHTLFTRDDGRVRAIIGGASVSAHSLRPYMNWERYRPTIEQVYRLYVAARRPSQLQRIGLRYINRFEVGADGVPAAVVVGAPPVKAAPIPALREHVHRDEHEWDDGARVTIVTVSARVEDRLVLVVDLDVSAVPEVEVDDHAAVLSIVEDLHNRERDVFEKVVTDKAKEVFDGSPA